MKNLFSLLLFSAVLVFWSHRSQAQSGNDNPTGKAGGFSGSITTGGGYDAYTGSATRTVVDLAVSGGVSSYPLAWARTLNTRSEPGSLWKNSYAWSIESLDQDIYGATSFVEPPNYTFNFPDGRVVVFSRSDPVNDPYLHAPNGVAERLQQDATNKNYFYLLMPDGGKVFLERFTTAVTAYDGELHQNYVHQTVKFILRSVIDPFGRTTAISYDTNGRLYRVTDPSGRYLQCTWTASGGNVFMSKVTGSDGQWVTFEYALSSTFWVVTKATYSDETPADATDNPAATYTYQASNIPIFTGPLPLVCKDVRYPGAMRSIKYQFATGTGVVFGQIQAEKLPANTETGNVDVTVSSYNLATHTETRGDGPVRSFTYTNYNLTTARDFEGNTTAFGYDTNGFRTSVKNALNQTTTYTREPYAGQITKITHPDGTFSSIEYTDATNPYWVKKTTDELGRVTTFTRDTGRRVTRVDYPDTGYETFTYNSFGQVLTHRMTNGQTESFAYNASGQMTTHTDPFLEDTVQTYDTNFRLASVTDPLGNVVKFGYNERGNLIRVINADNTTTRDFTYDIYGNQLTQKNELGKIWTKTYDLYNRLLTSSDPLGNTATCDYLKTGSTPYNHTTGNARLVTSPEGRQVLTTYDDNFSPLSITSGYGSSNPATSSTSYNALGQVATSTDAMNRVTTFTYDNRGRKKTVSDPLSHVTTWTYDAVGNVLTEKLADNTVSTFTYDSMNRLLTSKDALNQVVTMDYDLAGNLQTLTDKRGKIYSYLYDKLNRQTRQTWPDATTQTSTYDTAGRMLTYKNRAGNVQSYTYDSRNRVLSTSWSANGDAVDYTYDNASHLLDLNGSSSSLHYTYDVAGRMLSERQTIVGLAAKTVSWTYDNDGKRSTLTYPDGTVLDYAWSPRGELQTIKRGTATLVTYVYNDAGQTTKRTLLPGNFTDYAYDGVGRLDLLTHKRGTTVQASYDYGYNTVNNRIYAKRESGKGDAYGYDATQQLTRVLYNADNVNTVPVSPTRTADYDYDAAGNRISHQISGSSAVPYTPGNSNEYTAVNAAALTYDANKNLRTWNGWTFGHDAENQLASASKTGTTATFTRDPAGRIVKSVINGVTTYNIYAGWDIIARYNASGVLLDGMVYGAATDEVVCRTVGSTNWYYQQDGLGSVSHIFDSAGALAESYTYDAYGAMTIKSPAGAVLSDSAMGNRYFFTGREYLSEIDQYDYRNRTYSADLGRFLEPDPMGFGAGDENLYRYCGNDPVNGKDPTGLYVPTGTWIPLQPNAYHNPGAYPIGFSSTAGLTPGDSSLRSEFEARYFAGKDYALLGDGTKVMRAQTVGSRDNTLGSSSRVSIATDIAGAALGIVGDIWGILRIPFEVFRGISERNPDIITGAFTSAIVPKWGFYAGPGWGRETAGFFGIKPLNSPTDQAAYLHDERYYFSRNLAGNPAFLDSGSLGASLRKSADWRLRSDSSKGAVGPTEFIYSAGLNLLFRILSGTPDSTPLGFPVW